MTESKTNTRSDKMPSTADLQFVSSYQRDNKHYIIKLFCQSQFAGGERCGAQCAGCKELDPARNSQKQQ